MERLIERMAVAQKAVSSLGLILAIENPSEIERDAAIQRFEYSFEAVWKVAKRYLSLVEGIDVGSPKAVIRASIQVGLINEVEGRQGLLMSDDQNLTSHTYNEALAIEIFSRIPLHFEILETWLSQIKLKLI